MNKKKQVNPWNKYIYILNSNTNNNHGYIWNRMGVGVWYEYGISGGRSMVAQRCHSKFSI